METPDVVEQVQDVPVPEGLVDPQSVKVIINSKLTDITEHVCVAHVDGHALW